MNGWALLLPERMDPARAVAMTAHPVVTLVHDPIEGLALVVERAVSGLLVLAWPQLDGVVETLHTAGNGTRDRRPQRISPLPGQRRPRWTGKAIE